MMHMRHMPTICPLNPTEANFLNGILHSIESHNAAAANSVNLLCRNRIDNYFFFAWIRR